LRALGSVPAEAVGVLTYHGDVALDAIEPAEDLVDGVQRIGENPLATILIL
jgi:hypothetical protein